MGFSIPMREIWELQLRLARTQSRKTTELLTHPRFRAAYDFVLLREQSGENLNGLGKFWTRLQQENPEKKKISQPDQRAHKETEAGENQKKTRRTRQNRTKRRINK